MSPKTIFSLLLWGTFNATAQALSITSPSTGTTTLQANSDFTLRWSVNSTDPPAFDVIVATSQDTKAPDKNISVASNVQANQLSFPISWHNLAITTGSFCQIALINTTTDTLYAYSHGFKLVQGGASGTSESATASSTTSLTASTQATTPNSNGPYTPYVYSTKSIAELAEAKSSDLSSYGCPRGFTHAAGTESSSSGCWKTQAPATTWTEPPATTSRPTGLWQDWSSVSATMFLHSTTPPLPELTSTPPGLLSSPAGPHWGWGTATPSPQISTTQSISSAPNGIDPAPFPPLNTANMTLNSTPAWSTSFAPPILSITNTGSPYNIASSTSSTVTGAASASSASEGVTSAETEASFSATATRAASASTSASTSSSSAVATSDTGTLEFVTLVSGAILGVEAFVFVMWYGF